MLCQKKGSTICGIATSMTGVSIDPDCMPQW
jgi:hypothetical protein